MKRIALFALAAILLAACSDSGPTGLDGTPTPRQAGSLTPASGAWVTTDREDYAPGATVVITGGGFWAGEAVSLLIEEDPAIHDAQLLSAVADDEGRIENRDFVIEDNDFGVTFTLTASGQGSGLTAQTTFTDAAPTVNSFTLNGVTFTFPPPPPPGQDATNPITVAPSETVTIVVNATTVASGGPNPNATWRSTEVQFRGGAIDFGDVPPGQCNDDNVVPTSNVTTISKTFTFSAPATSNTYDVRVRAFQGDGCSGASGLLTHNGVLIVAAANQAPTADAGGPYAGDEGSAIQLDGSGSTDPDGTIADYQWSIVSFDNPDGGACVFDGGVSTGAMPSVICDDNGTLTVSLTVTDNDGVSSQPDEATVTVRNVPPDITAVVLAPFVDGYIYPLTGQPTVDATWSDPGGNDTHTCAFEVFDYLSNEVGTDRTCASGLGVVEAGVYNVKVTVTDDDDGSDVEYVQVVVYDPSAGFVTGGGWIYSAAGAYTADPSLEGKANFGFVSKYKKGATKPEGNTEFQFHAGNLNFHSSDYEWLVVNAVGTRAQYKGEGTINGGGTLYPFKLTAIDGKTGGSDKFRMQIFEMDGETVLYDNYVGGLSTEQILGGGSIVIHTGKK